MQYTISINESEKISLFDFNINNFKSTNTVSVVGKTFDEVKELFTDIEKIEIYCGDNLVISNLDFDNYASISYINDINDDDSAEIIEVVLTKLDIYSKIAQIDSKVNPVIDIQSMSINEYRNYILSNVSDACNADICAGAEIDISTGTKQFTFKTEDQQNLSNAFNVIVQGAGAITHFPYHASGEACEMFPAEDIIHIYLTLEERLTKLSTYCNMLNMYIHSITDKETLSAVKYGMELPEEYNTQMTAILEASSTITNGLRATLLGAFLTSEEE